MPDLARSEALRHCHFRAISLARRELELALELEMLGFGLEAERERGPSVEYCHRNHVEMGTSYH